MRHRNGPVDDHRMCSSCSRIDPYARDNTLLSLWRMPHEGLRCARESDVARDHCLDRCEREAASVHEYCRSARVAVMRYLARVPREAHNDGEDPAVGDTRVRVWDGGDLWSARWKSTAREDPTSGVVGLSASLSSGTRMKWS